MKSRERLRRFTERLARCLRVRGLLIVVRWPDGYGYSVAVDTEDPETAEGLGAAARAAAHYRALEIRRRKVAN